jgi:Flp pilus assembly pilin Flp
MFHFHRLYRRLQRASGAEFVEYALLAGLVALTVGGAVKLYGEELSRIIKGIADWILSATGGKAP